MSHTDGFEVLEGYTQSFRATVSDDDSEYASLEVAWFVGEDNVCDWTYVTAAGEAYCDVVFDLEIQILLLKPRRSWWCSDGGTQFGRACQPKYQR